MVDQQPLEVTGEQVTRDAQGQLGLLVDQRRRRGLGRRPLDRLPQPAEELQVALDVLGGGALRPAVRTMTPPVAGAIFLTIVFSRLRSSSSSRRETPSPSPWGTNTTKRPGSEISVVSRAPLVFIGSLTACTSSVWPRWIRSWILRAPRRPSRLGADDLIDVEEAVFLQADLDEGGLHARQHVVDGAEIDVARDRALLGPLEIDLRDPAVLEDRDALLTGVDRDQQLALGFRQRRAARGAAARGARGAVAPLAFAVGGALLNGRAFGAGGAL